MWHHSLLLMNGFNKTEAAVFSCRLCFLGGFPFHQFNLMVCLLDFLVFDFLKSKFINAEMTSKDASKASTCKKSNLTMYVTFAVFLDNWTFF